MIRIPRRCRPRRRKPPGLGGIAAPIEPAPVFRVGYLLVTVLYSAR